MFSGVLSREFWPWRGWRWRPEERKFLFGKNFTENFWRSRRRPKEGQTENETAGGEETSALKEEEILDGGAAEATPAAGEETAAREPQESESGQIRVLLMDSGYESYWHRPGDGTGKCAADRFGSL